MEVTPLDAKNALEARARNGTAPDSDPPTDESSSPRRPSQATDLVQLAEGIEFWHADDGEAFATFEVNGHKEHWPLKSKGFKQMLVRRYYLSTGKTPNSQALQDALGVLIGKAQFDGDECPVFVRVGHHEGRTYLDLCNSEWEVIEIDSAGWRLAKDSPIKFRRARGMRPLPYPVKGGDFSLLREFVNVSSEDDWRLLMSVTVQALQPRGPYVIAIFHGEQGSAKTTAARVMRSVIDPNTANLRSQPRDERDLMIAARNGWIVAYDNLSSIKDWLSDAMCRLATGSGFGTRELYTDSDETLFEGQRPMILNGITELATRGDLLDRAIVLTLPQIPDYKRKPERQFWEEFERARPRILGGLLDAVSGALREIDGVHLDELPRMADFAIFGVALERAVEWEPNSFMNAYQGNRESSNDSTLEASPVAMAVMAMDLTNPWSSNATALLRELEKKVSEATTKREEWPKDGTRLSNVLRRVAPSLRVAGIHIEFHKTNRRRIVTIRKHPENSVTSVTR